MIETYCTALGHQLTCMMLTELFMSCKWNIDKRGKYFNLKTQRIWPISFRTTGLCLLYLNLHYLLNMSANFNNCKLKLYKIFTFFTAIRNDEDDDDDVSEYFEILKWNCEFNPEEMLYIRKEINFLKNCKKTHFMFPSS